MAAILRPTVFAIAIALAKSPKTPPTYHQYGVLMQDSFYYYISEEIDGEIMGTDYLCNYHANRACSVGSYLVPDELGRIEKEDAWVLYHSAAFVDLNPSN